jgi:MFS transporter, MHS family, alpha-ketoglutarate permease
VALKFKEKGHETWFFWYVTIMIGLSLIVYIKMRDSRDHSLIHED